MAKASSRTKHRPSKATPDRKAGGKAKAAPKAGPGGKLKSKSSPRSAPPPHIEVDDEVLDFIEAIDRYRREQSRPFPSWSEVLHVLRKLGYRRTS